MAGILFLAVLGGYIFVSILLVHGSVKVAKRAGRNPWLPGISVALFMYLLVFWDFIPVQVKHHNLCKEQGGFWIYKTPEEWFKENPDAIGKYWKNPEKFVPPEEIEGWSRSRLSDYIYFETRLDRNYAHAIRKYEERLVDARTGKILAHMIDFERGAGNPFLRTDSITDYKLWLGVGDNKCDSKREYKYNRELGNIFKKLYVIGGIK